MWMSRKVDGIKSREAQASHQLVHCRAASRGTPPPKESRRRHARAGKAACNPRVRVPCRPSGLQHERSGGFASAAVGSGAGRAGEGRGQGSQALRPGVPAGRGVHLRGLPLEEVPQRDGRGC